MKQSDSEVCQCADLFSISTSSVTGTQQRCSCTQGCGGQHSHAQANGKLANPAQEQRRSELGTAARSPACLHGLAGAIRRAGEL